MVDLSRRVLLGSSVALAACVCLRASARDEVSVPNRKRFDKSVTIRGRQVRYQAEAGEAIIRNDAGTALATMFAVSFTARDAAPATRPVTFVWNGGPGAASFLLREQLSPRRTQFVGSGPAYTFEDNVDSLIDATDLVFIDPPGTGFSRVLDAGARAQLWGVEQDGRAFTQFIREWLRTHHRKESPKYLMGESYGGVRVGMVAKFLTTGPDAMPLAGVILVAPGLDGGGSLPTKHPAASFLPTQAATAWAHGRGAYTSLPLEEVIAKARRFAEGTFLRSLQNEAQLSDAARAEIAGQVSKFIGVSPQIIVDAKLAVLRAQFQDALLADRDVRLDVYDGRMYASKPAPDAPEPLLLVAGPPPDAILSEEFGYESPIEYQRDHRPIISGWDFAVRSEPSTVPGILKELMWSNRLGSVFLACGYFDLAVWYVIPERLLSAAGLPAQRFHSRAYASGHGVYGDAKVRPRATDDLRSFIGAT